MKSEQPTESNGTITKKDFVDRLTKRLKFLVADNLSRKDAQIIFDELFGREGLIASGLRDGKKVQLTGFGTFAMKKRKAKQGRNPRTGEPVPVPPHLSVVFEQGTILSEMKQNLS